MGDPHQRLRGSMIPIQCGSANHAILALYDPPESNPTRGSVVICNPWAAEYLSVYAIMRFAARRLSQAGFHVMRFDYYGCGDSGGEFTEGDADSWTSDAAIAIEELKALSGTRTVTILGARAGAMIASRLAAERGDVDRLVLWDPIIEPAVYLSLAAERSRLAGAQIPEGWPLRHADAVVELDGYPFTEALVRSTLNSQIDVATWRSVRSALLLTSLMAADDCAPLLEQAVERNLTLTELNCPWPIDADGKPVFTLGVMPLEAVEAIVSELT
jgi:pimeloyl-ACP methyl ester carboxylesterase